MVLTALYLFHKLKNNVIYCVCDELSAIFNICKKNKYTTSPHVFLFQLKKCTSVSYKPQLFYYAESKIPNAEITLRTYFILATRQKS